MTTYELIEEYTFFHFFLIPIFKWNYKYYLKCRSCATIFEVPIELGESLKRGENPVINDEDLKQVFMGESYVAFNRCSNCGKYIERDFQYCPHCGHKL